MADRECSCGLEAFDCFYGSGEYLAQNSRKSSIRVGVSTGVTANGERLKNEKIPSVIY